MQVQTHVDRSGGFGEGRITPHTCYQSGVQDIRPCFPTNAMGGGYLEQGVTSVLAEIAQDIGMLDSGHMLSKESETSMPDPDTMSPQGK